MTLARRLGEFAAGLRWDDVPEPVREKLRAHVLDTLGVTCAGLRAPESAALREVIRRRAGPPAATLVGCAERAGVADAALLNAFHGRIHTFDDTFEDGPLHPGSAVLAAALAAGESAGASGRRLLEAALAGYEIAIRVCAAAAPAHYAAGFHTTGTCNAFGAAAAAAHALGLDAAALAHAIGHAGEAAAGLRQYQQGPGEGSGMVGSALNGARAARAGVEAAEFAAAGVAASLGILEGRFGFFRVMGGGAVDAPATADGLGEHWRFAATSLKPYPTCRFTHGPVAALAALARERDLRAEAVESIEIATFRESVEVSDQPRIGSRTEAILSHQFAAAWTLARGPLVLDALEEDARRSPDVLALGARVRIVHDPALDARYPREWPHRLAVHLRSGETLHAVSEMPPGAPAAPLAAAEIAAKFDRLATPVLGAARARAVREALEALAEAPDLRALSGALAGPPDP